MIHKSDGVPSQLSFHTVFYALETHISRTTREEILEEYLHCHTHRVNSILCLYRTFWEYNDEIDLHVQFG
jgi:hypothetical protein